MYRTLLVIAAALALVMPALLSTSQAQAQPQESFGWLQIGSERLL